MAKKIDINSIHFERKVPSPQKHCIRCRILIVCEGEKTEPNYFKSFEMTQRSGSRIIDFGIDCKGDGKNTIQVVDEAIRLKKKAEKSKKPYDSVWAVFDKDNFPNVKFDNAIRKAEANGIGCAWSNEAFELWYVNHFDYRSTPMSRVDYQSAINKCVRKNKKYSSFSYKKNDERIRQILQYCGSEKSAIKNSQKQVSVFNSKRFHTQNPATTVYKLVLLLLGKDKTFNDKIAQSLGEV